MGPYKNVPISKTNVTCLNFGLSFISLIINTHKLKIAERGSNHPISCQI